MTRRTFVNTLSATLGTLAGLGAMYASVRVMHMPQTKLFWAVLILSGLIVAIFVFFLVWGHFQEADVAKKSEPAPNNLDKETPAK